MPDIIDALIDFASKFKTIKITGRGYRYKDGLVFLIPINKAQAAQYLKPCGMWIENSIIRKFAQYSDGLQITKSLDDLINKANKAGETDFNNMVKADKTFAALNLSPDALETIVVSLVGIGKTDKNARQSKIEDGVLSSTNAKAFLDNIFYKYIVANPKSFDNEVISKIKLDKANSKSLFNFVQNILGKLAGQKESTYNTDIFNILKEGDAEIQNSVKKTIPVGETPPLQGKENPDSAEVARDSQDVEAGKGTTGAMQTVTVLMSKPLAEVKGKFVFEDKSYDYALDPTNKSVANLYLPKELKYDDIVDKKISIEGSVVILASKNEPTLLQDVADKVSVLAHENRDEFADILKEMNLSVSCNIIVIHEEKEKTEIDRQNVRFFVANVPDNKGNIQDKKYVYLSADTTERTSEKMNSASGTVDMQFSNPTIQGKLKPMVSDILDYASNMGAAKIEKDSDVQLFLETLMSVYKKNGTEDLRAILNYIYEKVFKGQNNE